MAVSSMVELNTLIPPNSPLYVTFAYAINARGEIAAIRQRGMLPNTSRIAFGVVLSFCSNNTPPASSSTQYQLQRSPRSNPIVSFCSAKLLVCFAPAVLIFFIAGLLYLLRFERVDNLGAYRIPSETGLLPRKPLWEGVG